MVYGLSAARRRRRSFFHRDVAHGAERTIEADSSIFIDGQKEKEKIRRRVHCQSAAVRADGPLCAQLPIGGGGGSALCVELSWPFIYIYFFLELAYFSRMVYAYWFHSNFNAARGRQKRGYRILHHLAIIYLNRARPQ